MPEWCFFQQFESHAVGFCRMKSPLKSEIASLICYRSFPKPENPMHLYIHKIIRTYIHTGIQKYRFFPNPLALMLPTWSRVALTWPRSSKPVSISGPSLCRLFTVLVCMPGSQKPYMHLNLDVCRGLIRKRFIRESPLMICYMLT